MAFYGLTGAIHFSYCVRTSVHFNLHFLPEIPKMEINEIALKKGAEMIKVINHSLRREMLSLIHGSAQMTVTEILVRMRLEQSVASKHLAALRKHHFVSTRREGKYIFYSVNYQKIDQLFEHIGLLQNLRPKAVAAG
jgi:DNA-binding transcriptional ArsR family regulator